MFVHREVFNYYQNNSIFINLVICVHLPVLKYQLSLHTGDKENADTDGEIFFKLLGDKGNSCRHLLRKSNNEKMFQKGQVRDRCLFAAVISLLFILLSVSFSNWTQYVWTCFQGLYLAIILK